MIFKLVLSSLLFFLGLFIFFTNQFVSFQNIQEHSQQTLIHNPFNQSLNHYNKKNQNKQDDQIQVILIVIDALRYDYVEKFKFFRKASSKYPNNTFIKKVKVGNPTMTTQRIQSLMTGSQLFTATNILQMFFAQTMSLDNLINQLYKNGKKTAVMGDDTWIKLFGQNKFIQSHVCDSTFNIKDFQTCDRTIYDNIQRVIKAKSRQQVNNKNENLQMKRKFDLIIAHYLSLDHIGHSTSSILSKQMIDKMNQMSIYFEYLLQICQNNTMILITGDHGMRLDGNHGGTTQQQIQTLLFAFYKGQTKNPFFNTKSFLAKKQQSNQLNVQYINQVDITSTLALLFDVPCPANNIGSPIFEILPQKIYSKINFIESNLLLQFDKLISYYELNSAKCKKNQQQIASRLKQLSNKNLQKTYENSQNAINEDNISRIIQRREYLKIQINQKCLHQLTFTQPDYLALGVGILLMILGFSLPLCFLIARQLRQIRQSRSPSYNNHHNHISIQLKSQKQFHISSFMKIFQVLIEHMSWIFSLFTIYFSWYLIRNQSSYLLIFICVIIMFSPFHSILPTSKIISIFLLCLFSQLQPDKINEYEVNFIRFQTLNNYILSKDSGVGFGVWFCTIIFIWQFKKGISLIKFLKEEQITTDMQKQKFIKKQKREVFLTLALFFLVYLDQMIYYFKIDIVYSLKNLTIFSLTFYYIKLLFLIRNSKAQQIFKTKQIFIVTLLLQVIVLGKNSAIFVLIVLLIFDQINKIKINILVTFLVCQYFWWILGNRYEYSSINIKKSYVFSQDFHWLLNSFCLGWYFISPYLIGMSYLNYKQTQLQNKLIKNKTKEQFSFRSQESQDEDKLLKSSIEKKTLKEISQENLKFECIARKQRLYKQCDIQYYNFIRWMLIVFSGLISCCINLTINNQKILFTVVYVPLTILSTAKAILLTILTVFFLLFNSF